MAQAEKTKSVTVSLAAGKVTKNTIRFDEVVPDGEYPVCGSLYVQKPVVQRLGNPSVITIEISAGA